MKPLTTSPPTYTAIEPSKQRGHKDPISLWIMLLAGSVTVHLGAFFALLVVNLQASNPAIDSANIPVELVELTSQAAESSPEPLTTVPRSPDSANSSPLSSSNSPANNDPVFNPDPAPSNQPKPTDDRNQPPDQPTPNPDPSPPDTNQSTPTPTPNNNSPSPGRDENRPSPPSPSPNSSPDLGANGPLPNVPISGNPPASAGIAATLVSIKAGSPEIDGTQRDIPPHKPEPTQQNKSFTSDIAGCVIKPTSLRYLGTSVKVYIVVENRTDQPGRVVTQDTRILESSGHDDYDELVTCLINTWEFQPAPPGTQPQSELQVEITLNQPLPS